MSWTLCSSSAALAKAGSYANTTIIASTAALAEWSDEAEGQIIGVTRKDWITQYSSVASGIKLALKDISSDLIAMKILNFDLTTYPLAVGQTMLNVMSDNSMRIMAALKEDDCNNMRTL